MSTVESILALLNKWPAWKRITAAPERIDALEKRVAALENMLQRAPGEKCPGCGQLALRATGERPDPGPLGMVGSKFRDYKCEHCGYTTSQQIGGPHQR